MLYSEKCFFCDNIAVKWTGHYHIKDLDNVVFVGYCEEHFKDYDILSQLKEYADTNFYCEHKEGCFGYCNKKLEVFSYE